MTEKEDSRLTFSHEHIKTTTIAEFCWHWPEDWKDCSTVKPVKKSPHGVWEEGRRSNTLGTHTPGRGYRGRGVYYRYGGSFLGSTGFKSLISHSGPGVWHQEDNPLTGLNTSVVYRRVVRKPNHALEDLSPQKLVYSQLEFRDSWLKTALASAQLARTTPTHPQVPSGILLQPLLLLHCSPLRRRLPLPTTASTCRGNRACSSASLVSDQGGGSQNQCIHCQCIHSGRSNTSLRAEPSLHACIPVHTWEGAQSSQ